MPLLPSGEYVPRSPSSWIASARAAYARAVLAIGKSAPRWLRYEFVTNIVDVFMLSVAEIDEGVSAIDSTNVRNMTGARLKEAAEFVGIRIKLGTPSTVTLTVGAWATGPVTLSKGSRAQGGGSDGSAIWTTTADVIIPASGTATVSAECNVVGPTIASPGEINRRLSGAGARGGAGWVSVTNVAAAVPGTNADEEADVRAAILNGSYSAGSRSPLMLKSALEGVDGVKKAIPKFNPRMLDITVSGRTVPAGGMTTWIWPNTLSDEAKLRACGILYSARDGSCDISHPTVTGSDGVVATVISADGLPTTTGFWYVRAVNYIVTVTIESYEPGYSSPEDVGTAAITSAVEAYFNTLTPGDPYAQQENLALVVGVKGVRRALVTARIQDNPGTDPDVDTFTDIGTDDQTQEVADIAVLYGVEFGGMG